MSEFTTLGAPSGANTGGEGPGGQIGPFQILRKLGEGGFGAVFEAEQSEPVKRRVALKVIKLGMDTHEVIARFESERQALALMDHPHIARVLDAGATASGRPYFVMELVEGEPITGYCDRQHLSVAARLALFDQVCTAVQHAHTKGIIHRDLKPSNVLVSVVDGQPYAKVIDFGIAKATSGRLTDLTLMTEMHQIMGTPLYMSPEQAEGSADIDTRTDIYSLGVMLYELLTGTTPVETTALRAAAFSEIQRIIREVEPPRPSARLSQALADQGDVAARRATESRKLTKLVQGELDWIVMKALEKDRSRRYETANGLALDVRRYLAGEPVWAAPPSASYRMRKFVRRHKGAVAAGSLIAASLLAGIAGFAWQARIASARADELAQVSKFQSAMLEQVDPTQAGKLLSEDVRARFVAVLAKSQAPEAERTAKAAAFTADWRRVNATDAALELIDRTILKPAVAAIDAQFKSQPVVDAALRQVLADRYYHLGLYDAAFPLQERALATRRRALGEKDAATLESISHMGKLLRRQGKLDESERYSREAVEKCTRVRGAEHPDTLSALADLGVVLTSAGKLTEAEAIDRDVLAKRRRVLGEEHPDTLGSIDILGEVLYAAGKLPEAETYMRESLAKSRRVLGENHPDTLISINNVAAVLDEQGKVAEAESFFRESLAKSRQVLGEEHPDTLISIANMGTFLQHQGKFNEAEPFVRDAMLKTRRLLGDDHPDALMTINNMGTLLQDEGRLGDAETYFRESVAKHRLLLGEEHPNTLSAISNLGLLLLLEHKLSEAEPLLRETLDRRTRLLGSESPDTLVAQRSIGTLLVAQGKYGEAARLLADMEAGFRAAFSADNPRRVATFLLSLSRARAGTRDFAAAESAALEAHALFVKSVGPKHKDTRECTQAIVDLYAAWDLAAPGKGYDAKAVLWKKRLADL